MIDEREIKKITWSKAFCGDLEVELNRYWHGKLPTFGKLWVIKKPFFSSHTKITFVFVCPLNKRLITKKLLTKMHNLVKKGIKTYKTLTFKHKSKNHQCPQGSVSKVQHTLYSMARNSKRQERRPEINWAIIHFSITYRMTIFSMTPSTRPVASNPKQNAAQHY